MPDYKAMYTKLCHAQAKLDYLLAEARAIICDVQRQTEELYLSSKDPISFPPVEDEQAGETESL